MAIRREASVDQVAVAAALGQPWADVVLCGAVTVPQLESNLAAFDLSLTDDDWGLLATMAEESAGYWARRSALPWR